MFFMGWPINDINKRLELGMKEVPWGNEWWVPGGYLPVTSMTNKSKEDDPEPKKPEDDEDKKSLIRSFYCDPIEDEFKNKFKKFLFESRKRAIAASFNKSDFGLVISDREVIKLKTALDVTYMMGVNSGIAAVQAELGGTIDLSHSTKEIMSFRESRSSFVASSFRTLLEGVVSNLSVSNSEEKVREAFNFLSSKSALIAKNETEAAFSYGKSIALMHVKTILSPILKDKIEPKLLS